LEACPFSKSKVGTLHQKTILFSQEHHALFGQSTSSAIIVEDCHLYWSKKFKMVCRITIHSARRLAVGVETPIPLRLGLGREIWPLQDDL
jgi:hypothetical protein